MPGCVIAAIRKAVETPSEQRARSGIRFQSKPAKTPKMIARANTLPLTIGVDAGFRNPCVSVKAIEGDGWRVQLPDGLIAKEHKAYGYDGGVIARGWIGEAPTTVIVQVKTLETGFNEHVRQMHKLWLEHAQRRITVSGAADAIRTDGVIEFDGLGAKDDRENCTTLIAKRGGRVWSLTVRTRPEDGIEAEVEPIVASFELVREVL